MGAIHFQCQVSFLYLPNTIWWYYTNIKYFHKHQYIIANLITSWQKSLTWHSGHVTIGSDNDSSLWHHQISKSIFSRCLWLHGQQGCNNHPVGIIKMIFKSVSKVTNPCITSGWERQEWKKLISWYWGDVAPLEFHLLHISHGLVYKVNRLPLIHIKRPFL